MLGLDRLKFFSPFEYRKHAHSAAAGPCITLLSGVLYRTRVRCISARPSFTADPIKNAARTDIRKCVYIIIIIVFACALDYISFLNRTAGPR